LGPRQIRDNRDAVFLEGYEALLVELLPTRFFTTAVMIGTEPLAARSASDFHSPSLLVVGQAQRRPTMILTMILASRYWWVCAAIDHPCKGAKVLSLLNLWRYV
jgi:hypothetical protein